MAFQKMVSKVSYTIRNKHETNINNIVEQCIKSHHQFFDTFLSGIQHRVQANKNIDGFLTPQVGKALLKRFKTKDSMEWKIKADKVLNNEIKNKLIQIIS